MVKKQTSKALTQKRETQKPSRESKKSSTKAIKKAAKKDTKVKDKTKARKMKASEDGYLYPKDIEVIDIVPEKFHFPKECF